MKKIEVKILGLSYSQTQVGSYVVVLAEVGGARKIPIIIKPSDAQQIALKVENMKSPRPLTHDLFKSLTDSFMIDVQEIQIHSVLEGVFYTKLMVTNGLDEIGIECTAGDGISLSLVYGCPIYVSQDVMSCVGIYMNDEGIVTKPEGDEVVKPKRKKNKIISIEDLEKMRADAEQNEEYEIAAELRDKIKKMKKVNDQ